MTAPVVLDVCCGSRMMWFDKRDPRAIFVDRRSETIAVTDRSHGRQDGQRVLRIEPDAVMDFRALSFPDASFRLVAFDPPHVVRAGPRSWLAAKYGKLGADWREDLRQGFAECFRVLQPGGGTGLQVERDPGARERGARPHARETVVRPGIRPRRPHALAGLHAG